MKKFASVAFGVLVLLGAARGQNSVQNEAPPTIIQAPQAPNWIGKPALRWNIPRKFWMNAKGRALWLGGTRGKIVVIDFFRIGCIHCEDSAPSRAALYRKFHKRGVVIIGFQSPGESVEKERDWLKVRQTVRQWKLPYPIVFDEKRGYMNRYKLQTYPTVLVLDRSGIVRFQQSGFTEYKARELEQFIERALAQNAKATAPHRGR